MDDARSAALVEIAREASRARIAADAARAPADVARVLAAIGEKLYEPGFDAAAAERAGASDPETSWRFRQLLGFGIQAYVDRRRMETALELVSTSELEVSAIAASVGFTDAELFAKWFKRRAGRTPAKLRAPAAAPRKSWRRLPGWALRQALLGRIGRDDYVSLIRSLRAQYPEAFRPPKEEVS
jgi:AraC-like DNA-binding protein